MDILMDETRRRHRAYWDILARQYDQLYVGGYSQRENEAVAALIQQHLRGHAQSILDIGCGTGLGYELVRPLILNQPHRYTGIDLSHEMIRVASGKYPYCRFKVGAMQDIPFKDLSFQAVIATFAVLSYETSLYRTLKEIDRVLWPGGRAVLMSLNRNALWRRGEVGAHALITTRGYTALKPFPATLHDSIDWRAALPANWTVELLPLSFFGRVLERSWLWPLDRLLCHVLPNRAYNWVALCQKSM